MENVKKICGCYLFMRGWEKQPELLAMNENWVKQIESKEIPPLQFVPVNPNCDPDLFTLNYNPFEPGIEELKRIVKGGKAPVIVFTEDISPFNDPNWNTAKHRYIILDNIKETLSTCCIVARTIVKEKRFKCLDFFAG